MTKLTPFDSELIVMIRNLTGKEPEVIENENDYTIAIEIAGKSENEKKAIDDAINGRIFPRLKRAIYTQFGAGKIRYDIMYNQEYERLPVEYRMDIEQPGFIEVGKTYCHRLRDVFAVHFTRETAADVVEFCGNGIVEVPRIPNAIAKFTFSNPNGVFQTAIENDVIYTEKGDEFKIMPHGEFIKEFEPKDGNVIDYLNEKYGTDLHMRCKKLNEEINELFQVVKSSGIKVLTDVGNNIDFIDELADTAIVLNHISAICGFTNDDLVKIALDKIKGRETNPDFARRHPHKEQPDIRTMIAQKAFEVRQLQKSYFSSKDKIILSRSKQEEKELDSLLMKYIDPQTKLL